MSDIEDLKGQKHLYHSNLVEATERVGGYPFTFIRTVRRKKDGKLLMIVQPYGNHGFEQVVWPEHQGIARQVQSLGKGATYVIKATGRRESARWTIFDENSNEVDTSSASGGSPSSAGQELPFPVPAPDDKAPPAVPTPGPASQPAYEGEDTYEDEPESFDADSHAGQLLAALLQGQDVVDAFEEIRGHQPTDLVQRVAVTLFIQGQR